MANRREGYCDCRITSFECEVFYETSPPHTESVAPPSDSVGMFTLHMLDFAIL